jgi:hypothetical protein
LILSLSCHWCKVLSFDNRLCKIFLCINSMLCLNMPLLIR